MTSDSRQDHRATPAGSPDLASAWPEFERGLAEVLFSLDEDQHLVISSKRGPAYVQFAAVDSFGLRAESVSNNFLPESDRLGEDQVAALEDLGWSFPTGRAGELKNPEQRRGSPNFFRDFSAPVPCDEVARLAVRTLTEVHGITHPDSLEYEAFEGNRGRIPLPALGLARRQLASPPQKSSAELVERVRDLVLETIRSASGSPDLEYDENGHLTLRFGSALVWVLVFEEPLLIRVYSPVVAEIEPDALPLERLNELNARVRHARFFIQKGTIYAAIDVPGSPFVASHLVDACSILGSLADDLDDVLQEQFGGRTAFGEFRSESSTD